MLLIIAPLTAVNTSITPVVIALALLSIIIEVPFVASTVWPQHQSPAAHLILVPIAIVCPSIGPLKYSFANALH